MELRTLLQQVEEGRYALPEIQRPFVWENRKVRELFDSIRNNFPIGALLVWSMQREFIENYGDLLRPLTDDLEQRRSNFQYMVIDGQQRLVSIYLAKRGSITSGGEPRSIGLYYNVGNDELKLARGKEFDKDSDHFRVSDVLTKETIDDVLEEKARATGDDQIVSNRILRGKLDRFRTTLLNYQVNIIPIPEYVLPYNKNEDNFQQILERISEIFVRLNSQGTRIKMPDLAIAILTSKTRGKIIGKSFKDCMREITEHFEERGWDLDETVLMRIYMMVAADTTKFREAKDRLESKGSSEILDDLKRMKGLLNRLVNVLGQLNVRSLDFLKSKYSLVTLCAYLRVKQELEPVDIRSIRRWLLLSSFDRRYTGRLESDLYEDVKLVSEKKSLKAIEDKLKVREITDSLLDTELDREHKLALMMLLKDAFDLKRGEVVRISQIEPAHIHYHHIFPKDVLKKAWGREIVGRINGEELRLGVEEACNLVANLTVISDHANEEIKNKRPDEYLRWFSSEILEQHCIPADPDLWKPENYLAFVERRKEMLVRSLRNLISSD